MHLACSLCTALAERTQVACCANSLQTLVRGVLDHLHDVYRHREYRQFGHRGSGRGRIYKFVLLIYLPVVRYL